MALNGPKYKPRGLERLLDQYFQHNPHLDRALTSVVIPAFDTKIQQPIFFSSWKVGNCVPTPLSSQHGENSLEKLSALRMEGSQSSLNFKTPSSQIFDLQFS